MGAFFPPVQRVSLITEYASQFKIIRYKDRNEDRSEDFMGCWLEHDELLWFDSDIGALSPAMGPATTFKRERAVWNDISGPDIAEEFPGMDPVIATSIQTRPTNMQYSVVNPTATAAASPDPRNASTRELELVATGMKERNTDGPNEQSTQQVDAQRQLKVHVTHKDDALNQNCPTGKQIFFDQREGCFSTDTHTHSKHRIGAIIGTGGSSIEEIRHLSGSVIQISDRESPREKLVSINGTAGYNKKAIDKITLKVDKLNMQFNFPRKQDTERPFMRRVSSPTPPMTMVPSNSARSIFGIYKHRYSSPTLRRLANNAPHTAFALGWFSNAREGLSTAWLSLTGGTQSNAGCEQGAHEIEDDNAIGIKREAEDDVLLGNVAKRRRDGERGDCTTEGDESDDHEDARHDGGIVAQNQPRCMDLL
ncbi:hypothetical protein BJ878DRAFT_567777 [Calycina marina]|uniref:K Homology domain-containing protein n=1 Tax=Calycina marina TaxID=1763456 RepID=A0A9P8CEZ4_9HELO|nr:hypothetical protein BJ878DRAFT_567777 [Calycina marina]